MKAAILVEQNAPLLVEEVEIPELDVGQILVKVECSGICGKQLDEVSGRRGADPFLPHLLGHEGAGTVKKIGPGVRKVKSGDRVVLHWMKGSGIESAPPRLKWNGGMVSAGWVTTFSDYTIASENRVTAIPEDVGFEVASLLGCAVTTGLGIVFNNADLKPGQSIVVFGIGGVGQNVVQGASLVNAYPIVVVDLYPQKLEQATAFGASHKFNGKENNLKDILLDVTSGCGFDVAVDTTGNTQVRELAYGVTSNQGKTIFAGVPGYDERIAIDSFPLHFGRQVIGVHGGNTRPDTDIPRYLQLYRRGRLKLDEQITHRYPLFGVDEALDQVRSGQAGRCVLLMS
jgi:S-(hydroxymethyl)glutathione dehydrogenase/alcohol dehydrogenase